MKIKIIHSMQENLFVIQTKRFMSSWETMSNYFLTDSKGNIRNLRGFPSVEKAEEWVSDRYPDKYVSHAKDMNKGISFDF